MQKLRTHYDNLKVSRDAPPEVIRMAYKALVAKHHPDRNPGSEQSLRTMQAINNSYEILIDDAKRREHDRWIADQERLALAGPMAMERDWEVAEADAPRRRPERSPRRGCGCLGMASFLCAVLFIVFAVASTLTAPRPSTAGGNEARGNPSDASDQPVPAVSGERIVNVYWKGKQHPVRADKVMAIRKKVDLASWYVSEYLKLKEEKTSLEKRLESSPAGREQIRQKIAEVEARMSELDAAGMAVIGEVETEIRASAP